MFTAALFKTSKTWKQLRCPSTNEWKKKIWVHIYNGILVVVRWMNLEPAIQSEVRKRKTNITYSVQFSCSVMSDSLWPHELQQARPPYPSPTPGVYSNSCPLCQWCHPAISSSVVPFSSSPQSLSASGSFPMSQLFAWGGQSIGVSASQSFQWTPRTDPFRMDWLDLLAAQGTLKSILQHHSSKASILWHSAFFTVQLSHPYMTTGKTIDLTRRTFVG